MKIRIFVITFICMAMLLGQFGQLGSTTASAAEAPGTESYKISFITADTSMSGVMATRQDFFQIPSYWNVSSVIVNVDYMVSQLADKDRSSVTLAINGVAFYSFRPDRAVEKKQRLSVTIPRELLAEGTNTLSTVGSIETIVNDQICSPDEERDNWLQLYSSSSVDVRYVSKPLDGSIRDFNERFTGLDTGSKSLNTIAVPKQAAPSELEAAIYALSGFAKANTLQDKTIPLLAFDDEYYAGKKLVTAVALYDQLPSGLKTAVGTPDLNGKGLIQLVRQGEQWTLVVTAKDEALLVKASRLVANQALMAQLDSDRKIVDESTDVSTPVVNISRNVVLTEAGDELKGPRHQEKAYFVSLPANRSIADASKISLDFRYAKNLDFDRSMMTVLINNTPIGSKKLTEELANGDSITLPIPKNLDISGNFSVVVAFDLELKNAVCVQNQNQMPWAFVTKDSMLQLNTKDRTELLFNNYPYPFLRDGAFNQVAVVLPKESDSYTYRTVANLFNLLGQYAEGNTGDVLFYNDDVAADVLKARNVIAIGTFQSNKVIRDHNDALYFKYDANGAGLQSNEKMSIDSDYGKRIGTLQLIDSPYEAGHGLLAVTGADSEYYYLASKLVASQGTVWKVFGDGVSTDKDGNINAFRFKKEAEPEQSSVISNVMERTDVLSFVIAAALVMVLVLVSLIFLARKYRRRRGDRDEA